jgi:hypothetical protein
VADRVGVVFPNQDSWGTHVNIAGAAVAKNAKNTANAVKFMEYLASPERARVLCQRQQRVGRCAKGLGVSNPALKAMTFRQRQLQVRNHPDQRRGQQPAQGAADAGPRRLQISQRSLLRKARCRKAPGFFHAPRMRHN